MSWLIVTDGFRDVLEIQRRKRYATTIAEDCGVDIVDALVHQPEGRNGKATGTKD
jgi:hypothetical protein